jgi:Fic family protein
MSHIKYIWQSKNWPNFRWESKVLLPLISQARLEQGRLLAKISGLGFDLGREAHADILIEEAIKTSAIEGEKLNRDSVRSSVARHLGLPSAGLPTPDRATDGLIEVLLDATRHHARPLTLARMKGWQAALFPTGFSGLSKIRVGQWRDLKDPMRVVSGPVGKEKVHYEAPPGDRIPAEIKQFVEWWNESSAHEDGLLRSGVAHFYFVTIHPFEDGNGRIARAITDMALAQDEKIQARFYSLSSQIMRERNAYYKILEESQKSSTDITNWLTWYLNCHIRAVKNADSLLDNVLSKAKFWNKVNQIEISIRQRKVINKLLDAGKGGFEGGLTTRKYVAMSKVSRATAYREILELTEKGILVQNRGKGRSVSYDLNWG